MKTNIVVSAVRVNGYWYLRVKYDENDCRVRYQQSTGLAAVFWPSFTKSTAWTSSAKSGTSHQSCAISRYPNG